MNGGTFVVLVIVAAVIVAVIGKLIKDRREGKSSCGCEGCALKDSCHKTGSRSCHETDCFTGGPADRG